ncbi:Uma2 family endonuclease [Streptomyces sannanensis]|uniref:Uma2 family endonuclease n=2 Tax=Streptomyces sannanensis TaxID=285536 RepID=A0ABP6SA74_9ACTN
MAAAAASGQWELATPENWMFPPKGGWTFDQVRELVLPFDWELMDGIIVVRGATEWWHDYVRDELYFGLRSATRPPFFVGVERWTMFDEKNVPKPDIVVCDKTGLDIRSLDCTPVASIALAVEVVSPGSRSQDRFRKPGMYAEAGIDYFWRVERGEDHLPVVYEFWRDPESGVYAASPERPVHTGELITSVPFPVKIDLRLPEL